MNGCAAESGQYTGNNGKGYIRGIKCSGRYDCQSGRYTRWRTVGKAHKKRKECKLCADKDNHSGQTRISIHVSPQSENTCKLLNRVVPNGTLRGVEG